jgi:N-terminal acetyltransferase 2
VISHVSKFIPDRVKEFWHDYRKSLKDAEKKEIGDNEISEDVEMAGWGVKEAEERVKTEAST